MQKKSVCMIFDSRKPYRNKQLEASQPLCISLTGQPMTWVKQFKYLGHILVSTLGDCSDMRRIKRTLYFGTNMICSRMGFADKNILVRLFKTFCFNFDGCELWNVFSNSRAFKELCVAYHSCLKRLVNVHRSARNHDLCLSLRVLPCHMLIAYRQLSFSFRLHNSTNCIVQKLLAGDAGLHGLFAERHLEIRRRYDLLGLDLSTISPNDLTNIFSRILSALFINEIVAF